MDNKLIIQFKQDTLSKSFPLALGAAAILFYITTLWNDSIFKTVVRGFIIFYLVMLIIGALYYLFYLKKNNVAATLDKEGIWIKKHGFIAWEDIQDVFVYRTPATPIESAAFDIKDRNKLAKQSSFEGKCALFWSKLFGYPPIILANIAIENDVVVSFSKRFIKN